MGKHMTERYKGNPAERIACHPQLLMGFIVSSQWSDIDLVKSKRKQLNQEVLELGRFARNPPHRSETKKRVWAESDSMSPKRQSPCLSHTPCPAASLKLVLKLPKKKCSWKCTNI